MYGMALLEALGNGPGKHITSGAVVGF
jgi:hypothetical protein